MFEWDENKSQKCLEERGFDFSIVHDFDFETAVIIEDDPKDYGEVRYRAFNQIDSIAFSVVFTQRVPKIRIISVRKANKKERAYYGF